MKRRNMYFGTKNGGWENPSRHFLKKNELITNVLELRECKARSNPGIEGVKDFLTLTFYQQQEERNDMIELLNTGAYLVNGIDIIPDTEEGRAELKARTGAVPCPADAAKNHCLWNLKRPQCFRQHGKSADQI